MSLPNLSSPTDKQDKLPKTRQIVPSNKPHLIKSLIVGAFLLLLVGALAGCGGPNNVAHLHTTHIAGFWKGLWDGITAIIAFVIALFGSHVNIYEVHNNGGWYNFGFLLGIGAFTSGSGSTVHHIARR
jgi:hypothetical protein